MRLFKTRNVLILLMIINVSRPSGLDQRSPFDLNPCRQEEGSELSSCEKFCLLVWCGQGRAVFYLLLRRGYQGYGIWPGAAPGVGGNGLMAENFGPQSGPGMGIINVLLMLYGLMGSSWNRTVHKCTRPCHCHKTSEDTNTNLWLNSRRMMQWPKIIEQNSL